MGEDITSNLLTNVSDTNGGLVKENASNKEIEDDNSKVINKIKET